MKNWIIGLILVAFLAGAAFFIIWNWPSAQENGGTSQEGESFMKTGNLVRNNPGMVPGVWYLVYEEPGQAALAVQLEFTSSSACVENSDSFTCNPEALEAGMRVRVAGERNERAVVRVSQLEIIQQNGGEETMTVRVYFTSDVTADTCEASEYIIREIPRTQAVARAAINELLEGPTTAEEAQGFATSINEGTELQSISIENGIARVDFNETLDQNVGGSCMVLSIRSQIANTLKQFATVNDVVISINGESELILQP